MTDLSPAAQAVYDAAHAADSMPAASLANAMAAALRAAADQVVPEHREHYPNTLDERYRKVSVFDMRNEFLAIAAGCSAKLKPRRDRQAGRSIFAIRECRMTWCDRGPLTLQSPARPAPAGSGGALASGPGVRPGAHLCGQDMLRCNGR